MTNFETGSGRGGGQQPRAGEDRQLRARVQFLTQENGELAQVTTFCVGTASGLGLGLLGIGSGA